MLQHRYVEMTSYLTSHDVISDVIKNDVYRQWRTYNNSFSKGKHM